jgi:hypothetical protein
MCEVQRVALLCKDEVGFEIGAGSRYMIAIRKWSECWTLWKFGQRGTWWACS